MRCSPPPYYLVSGFFLSGLATLLIVATVSGISQSFFDPDESAHYVNSLFLGDWVRSGFPSPLTFAREFYAHFPKLSIGHWPPGWYSLLTPIFAVVRPSPFAALALSAFVAGLPGGLILWALARAGFWRVGIFAAAAYVVLPLVLASARHFLLDQPAALVVGLAAIAWVRATERPGWPRFLLFAALAAFAPLVKGNGALIALVPIIDIAIGRRWALLKHPALWGSALLAIAIVGPWYWLSFQISAGGFNYAPGSEYAALSLASNLRAILDNVGWVGVLLAIAGAGSAWIAHRERPEAARIAAMAVAVTIATLIFQAAIPVAIEPRYVAPLLPWVAVLAALALVSLWQRGTPLARAGTVALALASLLPAATSAPRQPPAADIDAAALIARIQAHPGIWLVDGRSGGEGSVIAAAAYADGGSRRVWVARASQWLSTSDFMGRDYRVTAATPAAAGAVLDRLGIAGAVSVADRGQLAYPHSAVLRQALNSSAYSREVVPFRRGAGSSLVATRLAPVTPAIDLLNSGSGSANVKKMGAALD
jgi:hypothetical protein